MFGPAHIIRDAEQARQALEEEFTGIKRQCCMTATDRTEPLDPAGKLVRVNLGPLSSIPEAADLLLDVLLETSRAVSGNPELMRGRLDAAVDWCARKLKDQAGRLEELAGVAPGKEFPVHHHSRVYQTAYRPAYRVVSAGLWRNVEPALDSEQRQQADESHRQDGCQGHRDYPAMEAHER